MKKLKVMTDEDLWYSEGLNFECTGCGQCCTGGPGYVWVNAHEIEQMASYLNLSVKVFTKKYLRLVKGRYSLLENSKTYDCVFLKDKKCSLYAARPIQCRTFPWWPEILSSEQKWKETASYCEGISTDAKNVLLEEIETQHMVQKNRNKNS